jgi:hypothetical protein
VPAVSDKEWMTATDAARRLHMTNWELWRAAAVGHLKAVEAGEAVRFNRRSVETFAATRAAALQAAAAELAKPQAPAARRRKAAGGGNL